mmetsp:Transcript_1084/g.4569  ORF Transcript_1084/g.4569 Transcript_1084/m.4569 type:complete len:328 (+) Transcript_1084:1257-2240(+)
MNDADAASMTRNETDCKVSPAFSAASAAIGNISAAAALFVTTLEMRNVAKYTAVSKPTRPVPETFASETSRSAMIPATPLFCKALDIPNAAAMVTMTSHFMASLASCSLRAPHAIMIAAAKIAATRSSVTPALYTAIIATAMASTGTSSLKRGGALSSNTLTNANPEPLWPASRWKSGPASNSKTSPGCKMTSPTRACTRAPSRCTANTTALYLVRNLISRMLFPTSGPVFATTAWINLRSCEFTFESLSTWSALYGARPGILRSDETDAAFPAYHKTSSSRSLSSDGSTTVTDDSPSFWSSFFVEANVEETRSVFTSVASVVEVST